MKKQLLLVFITLISASSSIKAVDIYYTIINKTPFPDSMFAVFYYQSDGFTLSAPVSFQAGTQIKLPANVQKMQVGASSTAKSSDGSAAFVFNSTQIYPQPGYRCIVTIIETGATIVANSQGVGIKVPTLGCQVGEQ